MSFEAVPTLQQRAMHRLLSNEDLAISALEELPIMLFPPLFEEAFIERQTRLVKAMVVSWPFPCLPLGALMRQAKVDNFQAVLDGMDWLNNQNVWPRRCRLQVLSLQDVYDDFWEGCVGKKSTRWTKPVDATTEGKKQQLKVVVEYSLMYLTLKDYNSAFMLWLRQRRDTMRISFFRVRQK